MNTRARNTTFHLDLNRAEKLSLALIMSLDEYRLSGELLGHSLDVRSVAVADSFIVSGSRDKTAKIWERHEYAIFRIWKISN